MRFLPAFFVLLFFFGCKQNTTSNAAAQKSGATRLAYDEYRELSWYKAYALNQLDTALILIEKRLEKNPTELPTLSAYAEVLIRKKMLDSAKTVIDSVLAVDPQNGHGYKLKGDLIYLDRRRDSTISIEQYAQYYRKASELEPTYGKAWEMLFTVSEELNDSVESKRVLTELFKRKFYTSTILRRTALVFSSLPKDAILITSGDLEYFPARLLQEVTSLRPDVVVLNSSLLNARFHFDYARRKGLFHTVTDAQFEHYRTFKYGLDYKGRSFALINKLLNDFDTGEMQRPICFISLPTSNFMQPVLSRLKYRGFIREIQSKGAELDMNADSLATFFRSLRAEEFIEPAVSAQETSPVMLSGRYVRKIDIHLIMPALIAVDNYMQQGRVDDAKALIADVKQFLAAVNSNSNQCVKIVKAYENRVLRTESGEKAVQ